MYVSPLIKYKMLCALNRAQREEEEKMRREHYLNVDKFGSGPVPANLDDVESEYNRLIDECKCANFEELNEYSEHLWEDMCENDRIGNVTLIWEEEEEDD